MTDKEDGQFKVYHPMVVKAYNEMNNYHIETDEIDTGFACIYFSSNDIYYPSDETTFEKEIVKKNRFEFYGTRIRHCSKHIFVRDVHKQWYLQGINSTYNTIEKTAEFLRQQTYGYKVMTIGSSAEGYAAALFGTLIGADYAICIDAQFNLYDEAIFGSLVKNPIVDSLKETPIKRYYKLDDVIGSVPVYYFYSALSPFDQRSQNSVACNNAIRFIPFKTASHGGPFHSALYQYVFNLPPDRLDQLAGKMHYPKLYLLRNIFKYGVLKRIIRTKLKSMKK